MSDADLGHFSEGFASWRQILSAVAPDDRLKIFANAVADVATYVVKGLDRIVAIDELAEMAAAYGLDDADAVQGIIARQFEDVSRSNGHAEDFEGEAGPIIEPLHYEDLAAALIAREWLIDERIPMFNVTLLSGEGAIGKSIALLQLAAAVVLGKDWLGTLPKFGPVLYIAAEEDGDEIRRRLEDIAMFFQSSRQELIKNGLKVISFAGTNALLAEPNRNDLMKPTKLFERIKNDAIALRPKLIVIDPVADVFGGKENDRGQTRMFCTMMRGLAIAAGAAVILSSHPSVAGIMSDSGLSGSTAWHNSVRARMYFKALKDSPDKTLRVLEIKKNNYGPVSAKITVRWRMGVYVLPERQSDYEEQAAESRVDDLFLKLLRDFTNQGRGHVTDKVGPTYAPARFAKAQDAIDARILSQAFAESMERLFKANRIRSIEEGPKSKRRSRIVEASNQIPTNEKDVPTASNQNGDGMETSEDISDEERQNGPSNHPFQPEKTANSNVDSIEEFIVPSNSPYNPHPGEARSGLSPGTADARSGSVPVKTPPGPGRVAVGSSWVGNQIVGSFRVIGDASTDAICLHCRKADNVKRIADSNRIGSKSETLHEHCAEAWFAKIRNQS